MAKRLMCIAFSLLLIAIVLPMIVVADGETVLTDGGSLSSGSYILNEDITLTTNITIPSGAEVTIDLNGHTLTGTGSSSSVITVDGGILTIKDSSEDNSGTITGGYYVSNTSGFGGGIYVSNSGSLTLESGSISGNRARYGGGVYVTGSSSFTINGGVISGNTSTLNGGGVYVASSSTFTMNSGSISDNVANSGSGGGVYIFDDVSFSMNGGTISGNSSMSEGEYNGGGGIYSYRSTFTMDAGTISNNSAVSCGGGVLIYGGTFTMGGGVITGNSSTGTGNTTNGGGGIYLRGGNGCYSTFTMTGGAVYGNTAEYAGADIRMYGSETTVKATLISASLMSADGTNFTGYLWFEDKNGSRYDKDSNVTNTVDVTSELTSYNMLIAVYSPYVAKIEETEISYADLAKAIAAAEEGQTVTLLSDIESTSAFTISTSGITLDLGVYTITNTNTGTSNGIIIEADNVKITASDGGVKATGSSNSKAIRINSGSVTIDGGTYTSSGSYAIMLNSSGCTVTINSGSINGGSSSSAIYDNAGGATVNINGGTISANFAINMKSKTSTVTITDGIIYGTNSDFYNCGSSTITISGGHFHQAVSESYCADGYTPVEETSGTYVEQNVPNTVAKIPTLYGKSLVIGTQIGVRYYYELEDSADAEYFTVKFTVDGEEHEYPLTEYGDYYIATCYVSFDQMAKEISAQVCKANGGTEVGTASTGYSVRQYYLNKKDSNISDKLKTLLVAMLNYGGYGQAAIGETTGLANDGLDDMTDISAETVSKYQYEFDGSANEITGSLIIENCDSAKVKFTFTDLTNCTVTVNGTDVTGEIVDNTYTTEEIRVQNWDSFITVKITNDSGSVVTLKYSVLSYAYLVLSDTTGTYNTTELVNLVTAMYYYNQAADDYLAG